MNIEDYIELLESLIELMFKNKNNLLICKPSFKHTKGLFEYPYTFYSQFGNHVVYSLDDAIELRKVMINRERYKLDFKINRELLIELIEMDDGERENWFLNRFPSYDTEMIKSFSIQDINQWYVDYCQWYVNSNK